MLRTTFATFLVLIPVSAHSAPLVPGPIKKKILITRFAGGEIICKGPNVDYRAAGSMETPIELFYYDHDPRRIWVQAGRMRLLGYDVSCEMTAAESAEPKRPPR